MINAVPTSQRESGLTISLKISFLVLVTGFLLYFYHAYHVEKAPPTVYGVETTETGITFEYDVITSDMGVDWAGGGDFDPRGKCPKDFLAEGFTVLIKRYKDGGIFKFLYHKGKKLLYRIDKETFGGQTKIGLHWVESTKFTSKYRIADDAFKGGKTIQVPNDKGGKKSADFNYGDVVSKKRGQPGRELFRQTHINPGQCPEWWDIINFIP